MTSTFDNLTDREALAAALVVACQRQHTVAHEHLRTSPGFQPRKVLAHPASTHQQDWSNCAWEMVGDRDKTGGCGHIYYTWMDEAGAFDSHGEMIDRLPLRRYGVPPDAFRYVLSELAALGFGSTWNGNPESVAEVFRGRQEGLPFD